MAFEDLMYNPMFQMGLGILGANRPGSSAGQAIGLGGMTGLQNLSNFQQRKEISAIRKAQADQAKAEFEMAKARAAQMEQIRQGALRAIGKGSEPVAGPMRPGDQREMSPATGWFADPKLAPYAPLAQLAAQTGDVDTLVKLQKMAAPPEQKITDDIAEYNMAVRQGYKGSILDWFKEFKKPVGTNVTVNTGELRPNVIGAMQSAVASADLGTQEAEEALRLVESAPGMVGWFPRTFEKVGGLIRGLGEFTDSNIVRSIGEGISPETEIFDETGNFSKTVTPTTIQSALLATKTAAREIMAPDKGPLTAQEQVDYKAALGMVESSDAKIQAEGLRMLIGTMTRRKARLSQFLQESGAGVPGGTGAPAVGTMDGGYRFKGGDPANPNNWESVK